MKDLGITVSGFWGCLGGDRSEVRIGRPTLFGHAIQHLAIGDLNLVFSLPPDSGGSVSTDSGEVRLRVGRPFPIEGRGASAREQSFADSLAGLDGRFRLLRCTGSTVEVATDLFGMGAVFYAPIGKALYFGSHLGPLLSILPAMPKVNRLGLVSILVARSQIVEETHLSGVYRLRAGNCLLGCCTGGERLVKWNVRSYSDPVGVLLEEDAARIPAREFGEFLHASQVREERDPSVVLMLSGGKDSRALALSRADHMTNAVTFGASDSRDLWRARALSRRLGLKHHAVPYESWGFDKHLDFIVGLGGGCCGLQTAQNLEGYKWAVRIGKQAIAGFYGGPLTGAHLPEKGVIDRAWLQKVILVHGRDPQLLKLFPDEVAAIRGELDRLSLEYKERLTPAQVCVMLDLLFRQASWISMTIDLCEWIMPIQLPFYNRQLIRLLFNLPEQSLRGQAFYSKWIEETEKVQGVHRELWDRMGWWLAERSHAFRRGRRRVGRVYWPDIVGRTDESRIKGGAGAVPELDLITNGSWDAAVKGRENRVPMFCISAAIAHSFTSDGGAVAQGI